MCGDARGTLRATSRYLMSSNEEERSMLGTSKFTQGDMPVFLGRGNRRAAAARAYEGLRGAAVILPFALAVGTSAYASQCGDEITRWETAQRDLNIGLHAQQSVGAQLHHQPTPGSVANATDRAEQVRTDTALRAARRLDAQGKDAECLETLGKAGMVHQDP
jgi:hypothetical protein